MKRFSFGMLVAAMLILSVCDCDPATQPCDVDLSTQKPPVPAPTVVLDWNGRDFVPVQ